MIRCFRTLAPAMPLAALLAACASAPVNYYTLIPTGSTPARQAMTTLAFDLQTVNVPAQVDQPQLVVRQQGAGIALVESERWIAPLADEVRGAIASDLVAHHGGQDLSGLPQNGRSLVRIKVDMQRFDSQPGRVALIEATWSLRRLPTNDAAAPLSCRSRVEEPVGAGYDALVQGHQRAIARLAAQLAESAKQVVAGTTTNCP